MSNTKKLKKQALKKTSDSIPEVRLIDVILDAYRRYNKRIKKQKHLKNQ
jgi:hypothetical protein